MENLLLSWLTTQLPHNTTFTLEPLKGDASFRRYFRVNISQGKINSYIAVISPPETENNPAFVKVSEAYLKLGLTVPKIISHDLNTGFLLITDLGNQILFETLNPENADYYYQQALLNLGKIHQCNLDLPHFDAEFMSTELKNFEYWFLEKHINLKSTPVIKKTIQKTFDILLHSATEQPQCSIHRDYHSKNIMVLNNKTLGILDFQDAMRGPITYDIISLIRDCYINWPPEKVINWAKFFHENFLKNQLPSQEQYLNYLDLMGIQRHLKASFIFARKYHRDNTDNYLQHIPRTLNYITTVSENYAELRDFKLFLEDHIL